MFFLTQYKYSQDKQMFVETTDFPQTFNMHSDCLCVPSCLSMFCGVCVCVCRFSDGLKTLGVLQKIKEHPDAFHSILCYSPRTLTAESLDELFEIKFSEIGSNNRADENRVIAFWRDYLQDAEGR